MKESKEGKIKKVAESMLDLIFLHGTDAVTPTRLSRAAGVSRSWIYKYLGGSQASLLDFSVQHFGEMFAEVNLALDTSNLEAFLEAQQQGFGRLIDATDQFPGVIVVFYQFRGKKHRLGTRIDEIAAKHLAREAAEIAKVTKLPASRAAQISASLTIYRLGTAHAWVMGALKKAYNREQLLAEYGRICRTLLT